MVLGRISLIKAPVLPQPYKTELDTWAWQRALSPSSPAPYDSIFTHVSEGLPEEVLLTFSSHS